SVWSCYSASRNSARNSASSKNSPSWKAVICTCSWLLRKKNKLPQGASPFPDAIHREEYTKMPKIKTHSGAKKRFKVSKSGKIKRAHVGRRHILTKKNTKRLRHLRKEGFA